MAGNLTVLPRTETGIESFQEAFMPFLQLMIQKQLQEQKDVREDEQREEGLVFKLAEILLDRDPKLDPQRALAEARGSITKDFTDLDAIDRDFFAALNPSQRRKAIKNPKFSSFFGRNPDVLGGEEVGGEDTSIGGPLLPPSTLASTATFPEKLGEFPVRAGKAVVGGALKGVKEVPDFLIDAFGGFGRALTGSQETESPSTVARRDMQKTFGAPSVPEAILSRFQSGRQKIQERGGIGGTIKDLQDVVGQSDLVQNLLKRFGVRQ